MKEGFRERERNLGLNHTMTECKYLPRAKCQTSMNVSKLIFFLLVGFDVASLHMDGGRQNKTYVSDYTDEGTRSFVD